MPAFGKAATAALAASDIWARSGNEAGRSLSKLGTADAPELPAFLLKDTPLPHGYPWGLKTAKNTNYYDTTPDTGVTRHYKFEISKVPCSPDGYDNTCLLINNEFPGPTIEANWGDWVEVEVTNNIADEGTTIHWHGLLQKHTPYFDGVPGYGQCPIAPNKTFTYRWKADLYGSSWYHSHWSAQYGSGLYGPIVIYGPKNVDYDADLGPVLLADYFHEYYTSAVEKTLANPTSGQAGPPLANNNLINGHPSTGGVGMATFNFKSGKTYRIRVINTSAAAVQRFSIDGYKFTVFANDFVPIEPYETDILILSVGQRNDILVKASGKPTDAVWMRAFRPPKCGPSAGGELVQAAIFYEDADRSKPPTTSPNANAYDNACPNTPLSKLKPYYPLTPPNPDFTGTVNIQFIDNGTALLWYMNGQTFRVDYNDPMLLEAKLGNLDFPAIRNVQDYGTNNSVRLVLENPGTQPHPMHLHGHNIWVLQEGACNLPVSSAPTGPPPGASQTGAPSASSGAPPSVAPASTSPPSKPGKPTQSSQPEPSHPGSPESSAPPSKPAPSGANPTPKTYSKRDLAIDYGLQQRRGAGAGCWDGSIVNPSNPQRRDVHMLLPGSYIVIQWKQDNPGVWPLHCHIAWHLSAGFSISVLENPQAIKNDMKIPSIMAQTCRDWSKYTGDHVVDQIDDGI